MNGLSELQCESNYSKNGRGEIKENGGGDEFKYDILIHFKNSCKSHNVAQHNITIEKLNNNNNKRLTWTEVWLK
jgi:hypothetical protein